MCLYELDYFLDLGLGHGYARIGAAVVEPHYAALENHRDVQVVAQRRPRYFMVNADDYALISPLLDRLRRGAPVPIEDLLDDDDLAIIAELEAEDEGLVFSALEAQPADDAGP